MENGRPLHYHRNTVNPPAHEANEIEMRRQHKPGVLITHQRYIPKCEVKHYARRQCVWCGVHWDTYRIVCPRCKNCQFCGLMGGDQYLCHFCGNYLPEELHESVRQRVIRLG